MIKRCAIGFVCLLCGIAGSASSVILPVEKSASVCQWQLIPYETVDGMKGKFAHCRRCFSRTLSKRVSTRVRRLKTVNNYDAIEHLWWLAF